MNYATDSGESVWLAWIAAALLFGMILADMRKDLIRAISARNVVLVGLFMWYLLEAIQANDRVLSFGDAAYQYAILLIVLSGVCFLIGYHQWETRWFDGCGRYVARLKQWDYRVQTLLLGVLIGSIPVVIYGLADPAETLKGMIAARHGWRGTLQRSILGDFRAVIVMIELFMLGVAWVALLILGDRRRGRGITILAAVVLAWYLVRSYGTGSRSVIVQALVLVAAWYFWRSDYRRQRQIMVFALPCAFLFYWFATAMVLGRSEGRLDFEQPAQYVGHEMFRELLFIVDQVPSKHDHLYGWTYYVELINPIPRFLWQEKPLGFGVEFAAWQGYDALKGGPTLSPGIIGEMYVNFGLPGIIFLSMLGGVVCRAWDRLGPRYNRSLAVLLFHSMGLGCLLMMGRSFSMPLYYQMFAAMICIVIVDWRMRRNLSLIGGSLLQPRIAVE